MKAELAKDVQEDLDRIINALELPHLDGKRIIAMRSYNSRANAYARIWALPKGRTAGVDIVM